MFLLAQEATKNMDVISGGAGWVGAGLLGAVLGWLLLKHLPDKDSQIKGLIDGKDAQINGILGMLAEERKQDREARHELSNQFQAVAATIHEQCREEAGKNREASNRDRDLLQSAIREQTREITAATKDLTQVITKSLADKNS